MTSYGTPVTRPATPVITGQLDGSFYKGEAMVDYTDVLADGCCARVFASYWADLARYRADM